MLVRCLIYAPAQTATNFGCGSDVETRTSARVLFAILLICLLVGLIFTRGLHYKAGWKMAKKAKNVPVSATFAAIRRISESLPEGSIAFNVPSRMEIDKTESVRLLLSLSESVEDLQKELQKQTQEAIERHRVQIAPRMEAHLTGLNFEISASRPEVQAIDPHQPSEWQWDVKPKRGGTQQLHLELNAILSVDGGNATASEVRSYEKTIYVHVSSVRWVIDFLRDNWIWLAGTIGAILTLVRWLNRRKRGKHQAAADAPA